MTPTTNGTHALPPVTRVLILGYYDGATDGVLQFGDGAEYRFDMTDEERNPDGLNKRTFDLRPLRTGSLDRIAAALAPYHPVRWPVWAPLWTFPTDADRLALERVVDEVLAEAGPAEWVLATSDTVEFATFRAERAKAKTG
jgi:hypothetical protein